MLKAFQAFIAGSPAEYIREENYVISGKRSRLG